MAGIQFHGTNDLKAVTEFYRDAVGMDIWLAREGCTILKHENFLLGFYDGEVKDTSGIITFFYRDRAQVDEIYGRLRQRAATEPAESETSRIYRFVARDPEDRVVEFQCFLHSVDPYLDGAGLLVGRRSVRSFRSEAIPDRVLWNIFEICRYSPTSRNSQSYHFVVIRDPGTLEWLAGLRGSNSAPIGRAKTAVAVVSDPSKSARHLQDGIIAGYHFLLAAWLYGLGTCWIAAMDRDDVKKALEIPGEHYVATITPLGYPAEQPVAPERIPKDMMVRFVG